MLVTSHVSLDIFGKTPSTRSCPPIFSEKMSKKKSQFRQNFITNYNKINKLFNRIKEKFERGDMTAFYPPIFTLEGHEWGLILLFLVKTFDFWGGT